jgi:orotidine-5'-phosphate decarboxylase
VNPKDRLIVALDFDSERKAMKMVERLKRDVRFFKVGLELFLAAGAGITDKIMETGSEVFLDLKFHDIPNTALKAAVIATRLEVYMLNVHALGGYEMMKNVAEAVESEADRLSIRKPKILAVTVLTSMDEKALKNVGIDVNIKREVLKLAKMAQVAGLDGVVASPKEVAAIRKEFGRQFLIVTPGVRPVRGKPNDQKRVATPREAVEAGADFIVVGRPVTEAKDPTEAARNIVKSLRI